MHILTNYRFNSNISHHGGIPLKDLRTLVEATIGYVMTQCQWDEFKTNVRYKSKDMVDYDYLIANFAKP